MPDELPIQAEAESDELAVASRPSREPLLAQREVDALVGYRGGESTAPAAAPGVRAMLGAGAGSRQPLPMLPVVFRDLVGRLAESLRGLFGGDVEVSLLALSTDRYADVIEDVVLPAQVVTFRAAGWDGSGLVAMGPDFACLALNALLGAGRGIPTARVASRPFSAIERAILTRLADAVLGDAEAAFAEVAPVRFKRERVEGDPRLAHVAEDGDAVAKASIGITLDGRSAELSIVLPLATVEPVRALFEQSFPGVRRGRDPHWSGHLATEVWQAAMEAEAVLHECPLPLRRVLELGVGDTLMFDMKPTDLVEVRCGGLPVTRGRIGRVEDRIAVQIVEPISAPRPSDPEAVGP